MGQTNGEIRILKRIAAIFLFCGMILLSAVGTLADGPAATFVDFKAPQYEAGTGKLIFIVYGKSGHSSGINIFLDDLLLDMVKNDVKDIDKIKDLTNLKLYDIGTGRLDVYNYWRLLPHCDALIYSIEAVYNRNNQTISSDKQIKFRSRMLDIDGVGFDGSYFSKELHIRKDVKVVLRPEFFSNKDDVIKKAVKPAAKTETNTSKQDK